MARHRIRRLALVVGTVFLFTTPGIEALAHEFEAGSTVSISASKKKVRRGKRVTISGTVSSPQSDCVSGREVLISGAGAKTAVTGAGGGFSERFKIRRTTSFVAEIHANIEGVHPHRHLCGGDISNTVTVKARRR